MEKKMKFLKMSLLLTTSLFLSVQAVKAIDLDVEKEEETSPPKTIEKKKQFEETYLSDLSESYRTGGVPTQEDFELMESKFKEDALRIGWKGKYWTQEKVDEWEIPQEVREDMNSKAVNVGSKRGKKEFFKKLNDKIKVLNLREPKPTDLSDLSETYQTTGVPTQEDFEMMENKFEEDYEGAFWTQERVDAWEISEESRERVASYREYCRILRKSASEFYAYWQQLNK